jgi:hypothetical protein
MRNLRSFFFPSRPVAAYLLVLCLVYVGIGCRPSLKAQNVVLTGSLSGRVTDPSGAVVPGVSVVVRNLDTGVEQSPVTNRVGLYRLPVLTPGTYSVRAHLTGFRDTEARVQVLVGSTTSQDFRLQVGAANLDTVMVTGQGPLLRPTDSSGPALVLVTLARTFETFTQELLKVRRC